jgi:hypothetical protein
MPTNWAFILKKYLNSTQEQRILTHEGLYKYIGDELHKLKLRIPTDESTIEDPLIRSSDIKWTQFNINYNIPVDHKIINMKISTCKLHPQSTTTFIIEEYNNAVNDFYFESDKALDNYSLREDINSFLLILK